MSRDRERLQWKQMYFKGNWEVSWEGMKWRGCFVTILVLFQICFSSLTPCFFHLLFKRIRYQFDFMYLTSIC